MKSDERETVGNLNGADRIAGGNWTFFSDDPVMVSKLRKVALSSKRVGAGWQFELAQESVTFRKPMSPAQRAKQIDNLTSKTVQDVG